MKPVNWPRPGVVLWIFITLPVWSEDLQESPLIQDVFLQPDAQTSLAAPSEAFLLYLAEIEVVRGDMLDPVVFTKGLARHSREQKERNAPDQTRNKTIGNDDEAANE